MTSQSQTEPAAETKGLLDEQYATERLRKPELIFRYKVRARVVADALHRFAIAPAGGYSVIDFGAAEGLTLRELARLVPISRGIGVELADELFAFAPVLPPELSLLKADVAALPPQIAPASIDLVSALALLEHVPDPQATVDEAARILKPGGLFVATCPNPLWDTIATSLGLLRDEQHVTEMDRKGLIDVVTNAGLELLAFEPFMWAPIGFLPYLRVPVSPSFALSCDRIIRALRVANVGFVNQCVIGRKVN